VPAAVRDWKDIPGRNRCHFKVCDHQEDDRRYVFYCCLWMFIFAYVCILITNLLL